MCHVHIDFLHARHGNVNIALDQPRCRSIDRYQYRSNAGHSSKPNVGHQRSSKDSRVVFIFMYGIQIKHHSRVPSVSLSALCEGLLSFILICDRLDIVHLCVIFLMVGQGGPPWHTVMPPSRKGGQQSIKPWFSVCTTSIHTSKFARPPDDSDLARSCVNVVPSLMQSRL